MESFLLVKCSNRQDRLLECSQVAFNTLYDKLTNYESTLLFQCDLFGTHGFSQTNQDSLATL